MIFVYKKQIKGGINLTLEELFHSYKHLVPVTLRRKFGDLKNFAKSLGIEEEDLMQMGYLGLWYACNKYRDDRNATFETFAIHHIKWTTMTEIRRVRNDLKAKHDEINDDNIVDIVSLDRKIKDDDDLNGDYYEFIPSDTYISPESYLETKELIDLGGEKNKRILELVSVGYNISEIARMIGISRQAIDQRLQRLRRNLLESKDAV